MARRKSKKSPETDAASPREALTRPNPDASGNASPAASSEAAPSGMVRKSTCIMGMLLTLALGLYLGGLLPGLINGHGPAMKTPCSTRAWCSITICTAKTKPCRLGKAC